MLKPPRPWLEGGLLAAGLALAAWRTLGHLTGYGDVEVYLRYVGTGLPGAVHPPAEYPPLALAVFMLGLVPIPGDASFVAWTAGVFAAGYLAIRRAYGVRTAAAWAGYLGLAGGSFLLGRYDLFPALTTVAALWAAGRGRFTAAQLLLAVGVLLKLYPAVLMPLLLAAQAHRAGWRPAAASLAAGLVVVTAGLAAAVAVSGPAALHFLAYAQSRPVQVESIPGSLLWLASALGAGFRPEHSFHSYNVTSPLAPAAVAAGLLVTGTGLAAALHGVVTERLPLARAAALAVAAVVAGGKVLSPQYLAWVLSLVALSEGWDVAWLLVAALTALEFPFAFEAAGLHGLGTPARYPTFYLAAIAARNAVLIGATVRLARSVGPVGDDLRSGGKEESPVAGRGRNEVLRHVDGLPGHHSAAGGIEGP